MMMLSKRMLPMALLLSAVVLPCVTSAAGNRSSATFIFVDPESSSFWNTARGNRLNLPVDMPSGATTATLTVRGCGGYEARYSGITGNEIDVELPDAVSWATENVYDFSLVFNDAVGTSRHASLGLVRSYSAGAQGMTRCLTPVGTRAWGKVNGRTVFPVPYGATSLTLNGVDVDTGLAGAQGWCAIEGLDCGSTATLELRTGDGAFVVPLVGAGGFTLTIN